MGNNGTGYDKFVNGCRCCGDDSYSRQYRDKFAIEDSLSEGEARYKKAKSKTKAKKKADGCTSHSYEWDVEIHTFLMKKTVYALCEVMVCSKCGKKGKRRYDDEYRAAHKEYTEWNAGWWERYRKQRQRWNKPVNVHAPYGMHENGRPVTRNEFKQAPKKREVRKRPDES